ncbi:hypothetical protein Adt_40466 [Abeliophyllum distichum]|uniref:Uncharacterized protein n=1 Tax=Abeliophyllum distichum TaxID=126358 RepID=A0ABD1Q849_9LAMI
MADVLNHGEDGGDEPPHQHVNRLQPDRNSSTSIQGVTPKADYKHVVDCIEDTAARQYHQYKAKGNEYIRDKGTAVLYRGLTADVWEKCIECSSSKKFKEKMVEKREEQTQQASSSGMSVNEHDVVLKVLGERRASMRSWTGSEGHYSLSLIQYDIAELPQYQSIYSSNQCIEVQNGDIHASNE